MDIYTHTHCIQGLPLQFYTNNNNLQCTFCIYIIIQAAKVEIEAVAIVGQDV